MKEVCWNEKYSSNKLYVGGVTSSKCQANNIDDGMWSGKSFQFVGCCQSLEGKYDRLLSACTWLINLMLPEGGSPGLVVMGDDSCSKSRGFKSRHLILDGHFFTLICCKNCIFCLKRPKIK